MDKDKIKNHSLAPWLSNESGEIYSGGIIIAQVYDNPDTGNEEPGSEPSEHNRLLIEMAPTLLADMAVLESERNSYARAHAQLERVIAELQERLKTQEVIYDTNVDDLMKNCNALKAQVEELKLVNSRANVMIGAQAEENDRTNAALRAQVDAAEIRISSLIEFCNAAEKSDAALREEVANQKNRITLQQNLIESMERALKERTSHLAEANELLGEAARRKVDTKQGEPINTKAAVWERCAAYWRGAALEKQRELEIARQQPVVALPDIGPDPLAGGDRSVNASKARLFGPYSGEQKGLPDQTCLVWQFDVSNVCGDLTWRTAAMDAWLESKNLALANLREALTIIKQRDEALRYYARAGEEGVEDGQIVVFGDDEGTRAKAVLKKEACKEYIDRINRVNWEMGKWNSAALEDPTVCAEMKCDIERWFEVTTIVNPEEEK